MNNLPEGWCKKIHRDTGSTYFWENTSYSIPTYTYPEGYDGKDDTDIPNNWNVNRKRKEVYYYQLDDDGNKINKTNIKPGWISYETKKECQGDEEKKVVKKGGCNTLSDCGNIGDGKLWKCINKVCIEDQVKWFNAINTILLFKIQGLSNFGNLKLEDNDARYEISQEGNDARYEISQEGKEIIEHGITLPKVQYWKCSKSKPGKCKKSKKQTKFLYKNICEDYCSRDRSIGTGIPKPDIPFWWKCSNKKCLITYKKTQNSYKSALKCLKKCNNKQEPQHQITMPSCNRQDDTFHGKFTIIKGHMQSGKTGLMIGKVLQYRMCGISSLIIVRNDTGDKIQLKQRLEETWSGIQQAFENNGIHIGLNKNTNMLFKQGCNIAKYDLTKQPVIMYELANSIQIIKIYRYLKDNPESAKNLIIFIDESDAQAGGSGDDCLTKLYKESKTDQDWNNIQNDSGSQIVALLELLTPLVYCTFAVSATILDNVLKENVLAPNILIMDPPPNYKGISQLEMVQLKENVGSFGKMNSASVADNYENTLNLDSTFINSIFDIDKNLEKYLKHFNKKRYVPTRFIHSDTNIFTDTYEIPNITLINISRYRTVAYSIYNYIEKNLSNTIPIVWTSQIMIYPKLLPNKSLITTITKIIGRETKSISYNPTITNGHYIFQSISMEDLFILLKQNMNNFQKKINFAVITGTHSERGISFAGGNNPRWHLNNMYYIPSAGADQPTMLQSAGRLCGNINDAIPLELFSTKTTLREIMSAYQLQEYLISTIKQEHLNQQLNQQLGSADIIRKTKVPPSIVPITVKTNVKHTIEHFLAPEIKDYVDSKLDIWLTTQNNATSTQIEDQKSKLKKKFIIELIGESERDATTRQKEMRTKYKSINQNIIKTRRPISKHHKIMLNKGEDVFEVEEHKSGKLNKIKYEPVDIYTWIKVRDGREEKDITIWKEAKEFIEKKRLYNIPLRPSAIKFSSQGFIASANSWNQAEDYKDDDLKYLPKNTFSAFNGKDGKVYFIYLKNK
jgi:hypothetical protein